MDKLGDKRVGIIGTGATAVQCIPPLAPRRRAALRLPAHAVVRRRPQQPPDRPRVVRDARAGLAAQVAAELRDAPDRRLRRPRTSSRTAGPTSRSASATASCRRWASRAPTFDADTMRQAYEDSDDEKMNEIRARVDARRARRGDRRGSEAVVPPALQAALLPRRVPAGLQRAGHARSSTPTARASSASTRPASGPAGEHYELDCLDLRFGLRGRHRVRAALRLRDRRARRRHAHRALEGRHADAARHARPRLPEPLHRRLRAGARTWSRTSRATSSRPARRSPPSSRTRSRSARSRSR